MKRIILVVAMVISSICARGNTAAELSRKYPVWLTYGGVAFSASEWKGAEAAPGIMQYVSPDGCIELAVEYRQFAGYPVTEIIPTIQCIGQKDSALIESFHTLHAERACRTGQVRVRRVTGSESQLSDFSRQDLLLQHRHECDYMHMTSERGLSSSTWLPYFGIDHDALHGLEIAVGWTGGWRADMQKRPDDYWLHIGLEDCRFVLRPGERFQLPTLLIMERDNMSVAEGQAVFHRFLLEYKAPRDSKGRLFQPWLPFSVSGGNKTDANMLKILDGVHRDFPGVFDVCWVDANWYGKARETEQAPNCGPGWFEHAGDWKPNLWAHPDGNMKKISDAVHRANMRFLVWFESERATVNAPIVHEHPEYFMQWKNPSPNHYLLKLGDSAARQWIFEEICRNIDESGIDIYRQDCNWAGSIRQAWRENDEPDRVGINEIRHINGLYALWDQLRQRYPDMLLENCAAGGRRMDYQMMSRSHSYCRDDAHMVPNCDEMTQNITLNSTMYIPISGGETFTVPVFDDYAFLSRLGAGTVFSPADFDGMYLRREPSPEELAWFRKMFAVAKRIQPYFMKDFYALTDNPFDSSDIFCAYQCNDAENSEGFFAVFRRQHCQQDYYACNLYGIDEDADYVVEVAGETPRVMTGRQLTTWNMKLDKPRSCKWVFYKKKCPFVDL